MCGIAGLYNFSGNKNIDERQSIGKALSDATAHRGPEADGIWHADDVGLTIAHRRLAIIDLSDDGRQPMRSNSGRYVTVYNGEIYNYLDLRTELETLGHQFKTQSDTEVMLSAFDEWGIEKGVEKLNGMFAIAVWDQQLQQLHLLRDRFGKKPLYFGWVGSDFVFASELKSFHAHPEFKSEVDKNSTALYMQYGYMCAPFSIFKDVWQLPPASMIRLDKERLKAPQNLRKYIRPFWELSDVVRAGKANISTKPESELIDEFEGLLQGAVDQRMISDVPLGAFLSGGIDSSTVVALMQKNSTAPVKTFSIGFEEQAYNEAEYAKDIAQHLGTEHQEFYVSANQALDVIPNLADIYDEPFSDASQIPTYLISKLAKEKVTVALTGDGGDEVLGGYRRHTHVAGAWEKAKFLPQPLRQLSSSVLAQFFKNNPSKLRLIKLMGLKNRGEIYQALISNGVSAYDIVKDADLPITPLTQSLTDMGLNFAEEMIFGDMMQYRTDDLMTKVDRASMAVALETRAPLMDYKLAEYCWTLPHHMKIRGTQGKWILRQVLGRHVPKELYERPKMGFTVPIQSWLQGSLKDWANDLLNADYLKRQDVLEGDKITKIWQDFQSGKNANEAQAKYLWSILMFQSWQARWIK